MIDLTNFVNINIERLYRTEDTGSCPIVTLFSGASLSLESPNLGLFVGANSDYSKFYSASSLNGATTSVSASSMNENLVKYLTIFFANGGVAVNVINGAMPTTVSGVKAVANQETSVVFLEMNTTADTSLELSASSGPYAALNNLYGDSGLKGIYQKIILKRASTLTGTMSKVDRETYPYADFVAVKYSSEIGAEMTIAAYLSKMKCYQLVQDYDFTQEYELEEDKSDELTEEQGKSISEIPVNFEMKIAQRYLNIGGNTISSESLVEQFVIIVLTKTCTSAVFSSLSSKLVGERGVAALKTALSAELNRYVSSGFLVTDRIWSLPDLSMPNPLNEDDVETVITQYTPLSTGYNIHTFALADSGRSAYIFLILATAKGIRYVQIDGKAIENI